MSSSTQNELDRNAGAINAEETLRLIASLPAPEGIEDRVKSGLRVAPHQAGVISWPLSSADGARRTRVQAMRAAVAAAIVFVVAGGGWEVYSHFRLAPAPTAVAAPQRIDGAGGLSAAGAKRTPRTLEGPVVVVPANDKLRSGNGNAVVVPQGHRALMVPKSKESLPAQR
jgi:hypothetical protein